MKNLIVNLKPKVMSYHVGDDLKGLGRVKEFIHSDTIFSGLMQNFARLYGKDYVDSLIEQFIQGEPPFVVSSAFLSIPGEGCFLPKPKLPISLLMNKITEDEKIGESVVKKYKDATFLSDICVKQLLEGVFNGRLELSVFDEVIREIGVYNDAFSYVLRPCAAVDRISNQSELFFRGETFLERGVSLSLFCKHVDDSVLAEKLKTAFVCLGDLGIGGERTYGLGQFDVGFIEDVDAEKKFIFDGLGDQDSNGSKYSYLISLYYPTSQELSNLQGSYYALLERRGWFHSPYTNTQLKRKSVMMFEEGSIIKGTVVGTLVDVSPETWEQRGLEYSHRIVRDGLAFSISLQEEEA